MKKLSILLMITFVAALIASSCNKDSCPAYSKADSEQTGQNI